MAARRSILRRSGPNMAFCIVLLTLGGCAGPLVSLAGIALGGGAPSGDSGAAVGPFAGAPSSVQNGQSTDSSVRDVIDHADSQGIKESCLARLPRESRQPLLTCSQRLTCIPGADKPFLLRVCPSHPTATTSLPMGTGTPEEGQPRTPVWSWDVEPRH